MTEIVAKPQLRKGRDYNKSQVYFLPMLEIPWKTLSPYMWDCFIKDVNFPELKERLFLLFDTTKVKLDELNELYEQLKHHEFYDRDYWLSEHKMVLVFYIPTHHIINYKLLMQGLFKFAPYYSKLTDGYKNYLKSYHNQEAGSKLDGILYRRPEYKRKLERDLEVNIDTTAELSSVLDENSEVQQIIKQ